jgi:thiazole synthase
MTTTMMPAVQDPPFVIAGRQLRSRLILGTGKYRDNETMVRAFEAADVEMVTVAVRRVNLDRSKEEGILYHLDP